MICWDWSICFYFLIIVFLDYDFNCFLYYNFSRDLNCNNFLNINLNYLLFLYYNFNGDMYFDNLFNFNYLFHDDFSRDFNWNNLFHFYLYFFIFLNDDLSGYLNRVYFFNFNFNECWFVDQYLCGYFDGDYLFTTLLPTIFVVFL